MLSIARSAIRSSSLRPFGGRFVHIERRIEELGLVLPPPPAPKANYNLICKTGNQLFVSGHLPLLPDGSLLTGRIGESGESIEAGYEAAHHCGLNLLATLQEQLGDLDRIKQIVKVVVSCTYYRNANIPHDLILSCSALSNPHQISTNNIVLLMVSIVEQGQECGSPPRLFQVAAT